MINKIYIEPETNKNYFTGDQITLGSFLGEQNIEVVFKDEEYTGTKELFSDQIILGNIVIPVTVITTVAQFLSAPENQQFIINLLDTIHKILGNDNKREVRFSVIEYSETSDKREFIIKDFEGSQESLTKLMNEIKK